MNLAKLSSSTRQSTFRLASVVSLLIIVGNSDAFVSPSKLSTSCSSSLSQLYVAGTSEKVAKSIEKETNNSQTTTTLDKDDNNNSAVILETSPTTTIDTTTTLQEQQKKEYPILAKLQEKIGVVDDDRYILPEYNNGDVTRFFSSLEINKDEKITKHAAGSVIGAAALVAGTTIGAGVLALPAATVEAGFIPSTIAMLIAYGYMTISGLLIAELTLNRMANTGKPGTGLLDLYQTSLPSSLANLGSVAYFFLHYAVMVAYIAQGGINISTLIPGISDTTGQIAFAGVIAASLFATNKKNIENVNNVLVTGVFATFAAIVGIGFNTADFGSLIDPVNQHPEAVANCFPVIFLAFVYQNIVPVIVKDLEGDRNKIIKAIIGGTVTPLLMFLAWNAVILGNTNGIENLVDPVALLQSSGGAMLSPLVTAFSSLALITSMIGFTYGLVDAWADVNQMKDPVKKEQNKLPLFALTFIPPLALSMSNPDIFLTALEYGGAFGVSTLFLVLPPIMVWKERYGDHKPPLLTKPMVPLGKIPLGSMWKAAATLILEQGAEKLGVFDAIQEFISTIS